MAATPPDSPAATSSRWVWHCSDASIAAGQYSVLALLETGVVFALYGWLAFHFERQWWLLLSAVAAPIILLRSEQSKALGVALLRHCKDEMNRKHLTRGEKILLLGLVLPAVFALNYWLAQAWLPDYAGGELWWRAAALGAFAFAFTFAFTYAFAGAFAGVAVGAVAVAGTTVGTGVTVGAGAAAITVAVAIALEDSDSVFVKVVRLVVWPIFGVGLGIGVWSRSLGIRVYASLRHPLAGLRRLPHNWREILLAVDFLHPPELLPGAGQIDRGFTVAGLLVELKSENTEGRLFRSMVVPLWYIPALLWRWSLKATLWLWWPLALLLRPPLDGLPAESVRDLAAHRVFGPGRWLSVPALLLPAWVALSQWPDWKTWLDPWQDAWWQQLLQQLLTLAPPPPGLRLAALLLCCGLVLASAWQAGRLKSMHKQALEEEQTFAELSEPRQALLAQRARCLERWHTAQVVAFILLGYAVALWLAQTHYPTEAARFIPAWLPGYL